MITAHSSLLFLHGPIFMSNIQMQCYVMLCNKACVRLLEAHACPWGHTHVLVPKAVYGCPFQPAHHRWLHLFWRPPFVSHLSG